METLSELAKRYLEYQLGLISNSEIVSWAIDNYQTESTTPENDSILKLPSLLSNTAETERAAGMTKEILSDFGFDFEGRKEQLAQQLFIEYSHQVLNGSISLYQYCRLISGVDALFDVPVWLGDIYNHCDWRLPDELLDESTKSEILITVNKLEPNIQAYGT